MLIPCFSLKSIDKLWIFCLALTKLHNWDMTFRNRVPIPSHCQCPHRNIHIYWNNFSDFSIRNFYIHFSDAYQNCFVWTSFRIGGMPSQLRYHGSRYAKSIGSNPTIILGQTSWIQIKVKVCIIFIFNHIRTNYLNFRLTHLLCSFVGTTHLLTQHQKFKLNWNQNWNVLPKYVECHYLNHLFVVVVVFVINLLINSSFYFILHSNTVAARVLIWQNSPNLNSKNRN